MVCADVVVDEDVLAGEEFDGREGLGHWDGRDGKGGCSVGLGLGFYLMVMRVPLLEDVVV